ncbi:PKD domain-containing protein [Polaribacter porphyrae]|uniref:PKD/Chitinase domain-containing protein n=1 Tax=Polaribacter porphyrae TaxID=1137780 RepID=A0A2S7WM77_9FLAO|nr:PKD domain-containing protein [Polaribacter porphyrae]PQJ78714.1 hypothetical protein BTO18_05720 [Polaribacter porphyrae]
MKKIKNLYKFFFLLLIVVACDEELRDISFAQSIELPSNISATYDVTQDNTGLVTITPTADSTVSYEVYFGDNTPDPAIVTQGENVQHTYAEGTYQVKIVASNLNGDKVEATQQLVVSFKAPQNLVVVIENDAAISKQVNITANADFATMYEFDSGETGVTQPVANGNIGNTISYQYATAGTYSVKVIAKGAAIATTEYAVDFEVTEILAPIVAASKPPTRNDVDVISIFSDAYTDVTLDELPTSWSVGNFEAVNLNNDNVWKLTSLDFLGMVTNYTNGIDVSAMEKLHIDYWVPEGVTNELLIKIVNTVDGGEDIESLGTTVTGSWQSIDIDMTGFDGGNLANKEKITQILIDSDGIAGVVYVDNFYFYKAPSGVSPPLLSDDFEGNGNIPAFSGDAAGANIIDNPQNNAGNFSNKILEYTDTGGQYANIQFTAPTKFDLKNGQSVFSINLYVPSSSITGNQTNQVSLKLQNSDLGGNSWQTQTEIIKTIVLDQWQTVTFDFVNDNWINLNNNGVDPDPVDRTDLDKVVIQLNSENNNDAVTGYIDDFYYGVAQVQDTAPIVKDGFEGQGTIPAWVGDAAGANTSFANPFVNADNNSATVLEYTDTGGQYANVNFTVANKFNLVNKSKFSIKIYVPSSSISGSQNNQVSLKLQNSDLGGNSWQTQTEIIKTIVLDQWQVITFDFVNDNWINLNNNGVDPDPIDRTDLDKVVIQINGENNNDTVTAYIDNVNYY